MRIEENVLKIIIFVLTTFTITSWALYYSFDCHIMCSIPPECSYQGMMTGYFSLSLLVVLIAYGFVRIFRGENELQKSA